MGLSLIGILAQSIVIGAALGSLLWFVVNGILGRLNGKAEKFDREVTERWHSVTAHLVKSYFASTEDEKDECHTAIYEYEACGFAYTRTYRCYEQPSSEITLYWDDDPAKAGKLTELERKHGHPYVYMLVCIAVVFACFMLFR